MVPSEFGLPTLWHCSQPLAIAGSAFQLHKGMWRPARPARLVRFPKVNLLGRETLLAVNGSPRGRGVPAVQELLVNGFMAASAIPRGELGGNYESVVVFLFLAGGGLVAIQAIHALAGVQLISYSWTTEYCVARMTFGALSGGANQAPRWAAPSQLGAWRRSQERRPELAKGNHHGQKNRAERHARPPALRYDNTPCLVFAPFLGKAGLL